MKIRELFCRHNFIKGREVFFKPTPMSEEVYLKKNHSIRLREFGCIKCNKVIIKEDAISGGSE